jgi:hypothetical protein
MKFKNMEKILLFSLLFWSSFAWNWMKNNNAPDWLFYWFLVNIILLIILIVKDWKRGKK